MEPDAEIKVAAWWGRPAPEMEDSLYPPDVDRPRPKAERVEWLLASAYCTCGVGNDTCAGHFDTLVSCNPNGCGMPNRRRELIGKPINRGLADCDILAQLVKESGPPLFGPHRVP